MPSNAQAERSSDDHKPEDPIQSLDQTSQAQEIDNPSDGSSTVSLALVHSTSQHSADSHRGSVSPIISRARAPTDVTSSISGDVQAEDHMGIVEVEEDHAFLAKASHTGTSRTPTIRKRTKRRDATLLKTWWFELASLTTAMAALIAIAITLAEYNNKEQPKWKFSLNLNTLIAILATLLRACMVAVAEEVISQLKWFLFRQPRPLQHLAHYDSAARGPWGSLLLVFRTRSLDSALLGCIVIFLSVGIGPFSQQAVKSVSCDRPLEGVEASIRVSRWMTFLNLARISGLDWDLDLNTKIAISDGIGNPNTTRSNIVPSCSTGNCAFSSYNGVTHSSLGLCKKCAVTTPWLRAEDSVQFNNGPYGPKINYTLQYMQLPGGHGIGGWEKERRPPAPKTIVSISEHNPRFFNTYPLNGSLLEAFDDSFDDIFKASILNVSILSFTNNGCESLPQDKKDWALQKCPGINESNSSFATMDFLNAVATTCSFYPCVRDYHGSVRDTIFTENVVKETPIIQPEGQEISMLNDYFHFHAPCRIDNEIYTVDNISSIPRDGHNFTSIYINGTNTTFPTECTYGISAVYALSLGAFINSSLVGDCIAPPRIEFNGDPDDYNSLVCSPWQIKALNMKGNASFESINHNMEATALAVTSEIRKQGTGQIEINDPIPLYATGSVVRTTVCTKFDWVWLSFPLALIVVTMLFLGIAYVRMLLDKQMIPAWKSSLLPLLLVGNRLKAVAGAKDLDTIKKETDTLVVRLEDDGKSWEFAVEAPEYKE